MNMSYALWHFEITHVKDKIDSCTLICFCYQVNIQNFQPHES
jgi:hypothetical protein